MKHHTTFSFDFADQTEMYFKLLSEEDYDFRTKDINIDINQTSQTSLSLDVECDSIIDLKIASTAIIKSLEVIQKTLEV